VLLRSDLAGLRLRSQIPSKLGLRVRFPGTIIYDLLLVFLFVSSHTELPRRRHVFSRLCAIHNRLERISLVHLLLLLRKPRCIHLIDCVETLVHRSPQGRRSNLAVSSGIRVYLVF